VHRRRKKNGVECEFVAHCHREGIGEQWVIH
jgi:hypothetical protein